MMTKNQSTEREQLEILTIDQLVPEDHLVRKLESAIDFSFIYLLVENFIQGSVVQVSMLTFAAMNLKKLATWTWQVA